MQFDLQNYESALMVIEFFWDHEHMVYKRFFVCGNIRYLFRGAIVGLSNFLVEINAFNNW